MLTRADVTGKHAGHVAKSQAITLEQALPLFTISGARSLGEWADFITLERPQSEMSPEEIGAIQPLETRWKGRIVFSA